MNILAIETSTTQGSLAIETAISSAQIILNNPKKQISTILPELNSLLVKAELRINEFDMFVLSHGPGSFTGIRLGLDIIQGLNLPLDKPIVGISSLQALAQTAYRLHNTDDVLCATNAYMGELYFAHYRINDKKMMSLANQEQLISPESIDLPGGKCDLIGDGWEYYYDTCDSPKNKQNKFLSCYPEASDLITLAKGQSELLHSTADTIELNYLRRKDAWKSTS